MTIDILTLFPGLFEEFAKTSILGKAITKDILKLKIHNIRDFAKNKHKQVDDYPYGGGQGMIMTPQPLFDALHSLVDKIPDVHTQVIYFTPKGKILKQDMAAYFANFEHLVLLCGHYEGIDQRVIDRFVDHEISIGDFVLTGGELPAMVFVDCIIRFLSGVLGNPDSAQDESFSRNLLEYPQYTRPQTYEGMNVPDVLLSGNHKEIERYRMIESIKLTLDRRPDLINKDLLSHSEKAYLQEIVDKNCK